MAPTYACYPVGEGSRSLPAGSPFFQEAAIPLSLLYWILWLFLLILGGIFGWQRNGWAAGALLLAVVLFFLLGVKTFGPIVQ